MGTHTQQQSSSGFGFGGCNLAAAALFNSATLMASYSNDIMKLFNDFKAKMAKQYGGLDGHEGLVQRFLAIACQAASQASDALKDEAKGYLVNGCMGLAGVAGSLGSELLAAKANKPLEDQLEDGQAMKNALNNNSEEEFDLDAFDQASPEAKEIQKRANDWKVDKSSLADYQSNDPVQRQRNEDAVKYLKGKDAIQKQFNEDEKSDLDAVRENLDKKMDNTQAQINSNTQKWAQRGQTFSQGAGAFGNIGQSCYKTDQADDQQKAQETQANQEIVKQVNSSYEQRMQDAQAKANQAQQEADQAADALGAILRGQTRG